jgi:colanic acid biosynthesis glycosyl transferase WcaI
MSDTIITLGENIRQQILLRGVATECVQILPFWIDTQRIRPLDSDNSWRRRQGIAPERFVAIFAGTIGYASGAQMLVHTAEKLADRPDILLLIVGEGPVKNELEVLANQRNLTNMRFLPFQPEEYLAEMQSTADVGLVTLLPKSSFTSVPSKVLGYMASGRAVVASVPAHSDTAQLINTAGCGIVVEAQDPQAMAQAIATLADDRQRCQNLGSRARSYTVEHLSRQAAVKQFQKVIMES